jgi:hypothetical protein
MMQVPLTGHFPARSLQAKVCRSARPHGVTNRTRRHPATIFESAGCLGPRCYEEGIITFESPIVSVLQAKSIELRGEPNRYMMIEHDNIKLGCGGCQCKNSSDLGEMSSMCGNKHSRI